LDTGTAELRTERLLNMTPTADEKVREDEVLLPCPFCGGKAYYTESVNGSNMAYVGCTVCGISAKAARTGFNLSEWTRDLKLVWNTRKADAILSSNALQTLLQQEREAVKEMAAQIAGGFIRTAQQFKTYNREGALAACKLIAEDIRAVSPGNALALVRVDAQIEAALVMSSMILTIFADQEPEPLAWEGQAKIVNKAESDYVAALEAERDELLKEGK
jgi:hypothetical protein